MTSKVFAGGDLEQFDNRLCLLSAFTLYNVFIVTLCVYYLSDLHY